MSLKLTIGMATHQDPLLWPTIQSLRLHHDLSEVELVVVDQSPESRLGKEAKGLMSWCASSGQNALYIPMPEPAGTSAPRQRVFEAARGEAVMCIDSHVFLPPGAIARLLEFYAANPETRDLYSGPILNDGLGIMATHFTDVWGPDGMWGQWGLDKKGMALRKAVAELEAASGKDVDREGEPFEIGAMGLGLFTCRRDAWLGFNPNFRGFGGEEWYIHEKFRKAGHKCVCLPWLKWSHKFKGPGEVTYKSFVWDKARNYVIGLTELGIPLDRARAAFVDGGKLSAEQWDVLTANPSNPPLAYGPQARATAPVVSADLTRQQAAYLAAKSEAPVPLPAPVPAKPKREPPKPCVSLGARVRDEAGAVKTVVCPAG